MRLALPGWVYWSFRQAPYLPCDPPVELNARRQVRQLLADTGIIAGEMK
jgi:hypothetical protein